MSPKDSFHKISYLQYPLMLAALFFAFKPYVVGFDTVVENYTNCLIFMGLGLSFSTLQDTQKTQNAFSKKVWENPKKGKLMLVLISLFALILLIIGLVGLYFSSNETLREISIGSIVLGVGVISLLKSAVELYENHRMDKR